MMLNTFPSMLHEWERKQFDCIKQLAAKEAEDDAEVYLSIVGNESMKFGICAEEEHLFYEAMIIMIYSYYVSALTLLKNISGAKQSWPSNIAQACNNSLNKQYKDIAEYLYKTIRPLRNELCHNNEANIFCECEEEEKQNILKLESQNVIEIIMGHSIIVRDRDFVINTLDSTHLLLKALLNMCESKPQCYDSNCK